jgi:hypothetical protein
MAITKEQREYFKTKFASGNEPATDSKEVVKQIVSSVSRPNPQGFVAETVDDVKGIFTGIGQRAGERADKYGAADKAQESGEQGTLQTLFQKFGQGAAFVGDIAGEVVKGGIKTVLPQGGEDFVKEKVGGVVESAMQLDPVQTFVQRYENIKQTDPAKARDIDAVLGITELFATGLGAGLAKEPIKQGIKKTVEVAKDMGGGVGGALQTVKPFVEGTKDVVTGVARGVAGVPRRIQQNVSGFKEATKATNALAEKVVKQTGRETVRNAVRNAVSSGVDRRDVGTLASVAKSKAKKQVKELYETARKVASGDTDIDLAQIVGKPAVTALKKREVELKSVGEQIGKAAEKLGKVTRQEIEPQVITSLKQVPGLSNLKVKNGRLDFTDTVLAGPQNEKLRNQLQQQYLFAIRSGTGKSKHVYRQSLFETLRGKQRSLAELTKTQEEALEAIRQGLANVLDKKNDLYKELNQKYASMNEPIKELRKKLKAGIDSEDDILEATAGDLARRITSNSPSRNEIYALFKELGAGEEVKNLQEALNVFARYLDVNQRTSMGGIIETSLDKAIPKNILEIAGEALQQTAGKTPIVREAELESLMKELFR